MCLVDATPEELALNLSRASVEAQERIENQLRERASAVLAAASIVVPVIALVFGHGPGTVAIPFGIAAAAYALCVLECGFALMQHGGYKGILGSELLEAARSLDVDLSHMQETAARYLDGEYRQNREILNKTASCVRREIMMLTSEIIALSLALWLILLR